MVRHLGDLMKNLFIHQESAEQEDKYLPPNDDAMAYIRSMPVYQEYSYPLITGRVLCQTLAFFG